VERGRLDPVQGVLAVLDEGAATGANKFGLLLALIDLAPLAADDVLSVDAIAEKLLEIQWDQGLPFHEGQPLRQVTSGNRANTTVIQEIVRLYEELGGPVPYETAWLRLPAASWRRAVRKVAAATAKNPLKLLQRLPGDPAPFLYELDERGRAIRFLPGAVDALVVYGPVLRDLVQFRFVRFVAAANRAVLGASVEEDLERHLFGAARHMPPPAMRRDLWELQGGRCLYTGRSVADPSHGGRASALDHVLAWSRVRLSVTENFVVTSTGFNSTKGAALLGGELIAVWVDHLTRHRDDLAAISARHGWPSDPRRAGTLALAVYRGASPATPALGPNGTLRSLDEYPRDVILEQLARVAEMPD
jgi:hypothetical protein